MDKFIVESVNISEKKGIIKKPVEKIEIDNYGIVGDAHAGAWHRQVSLLAKESIEKAEAKAKTKFPMGTFAENITTKGIELHSSSILDRFVGDNVELEVTQIGKICHDKCSIGKRIGNCIMPMEGIFCRVIKGGSISPGDSFEYIQKNFKIKIITLSDRAYSGIYEDKSGQLICDRIQNWCSNHSFKYSIEKTIIPDEAHELNKVLEETLANDYDIIISTGSTGIGPRDIAPETVKPWLEKELSGVMELIRVKYGMQNPNAILSRSIAGTKDKTMIFTLPGNVKAVEEYLTEILGILFHSILMIHSINRH